MYNSVKRNHKQNKQNLTEYCVSCGIKKEMHWMVNHIFLSNLNYTVTENSNICNICGQYEKNHQTLLHSFQQRPKKIKKLNNSLPYISNSL